MTSARVSTCIVGGGPAGLMLGLLLAKRGADVLVLEGHETLDREFRGEVLQPGTVHLLDELGLLEYILAQPHSLLDAGKIRLNGEEVGEFSFRKIAPEYPCAIWMPQPIFLDALLRKAQPFPSFQCWMGARVATLLEDGDRVAGVSGLRHGKEAFEVRADVVVGADGRHSTVARLGGFTPEYEHHDFDVIWFTIEQPAGWSSTFYVSLGEVRGLMLPKYPHHIQAGIILPPGEWRRWRQNGVAAVAERVRRFDPISAGFAAALRDFTPFFPLAGTIRVNVAIATAAVTAQVLVPHLGHGPISREDLQAVQRLREDDVRALHRLQIGAQRVFLGQGSGNPIVKWLLPKVLPLFLRSPLLPMVQRRIFFGAPLPPLDRA